MLKICKLYYKLNMLKICLKYANDLVFINENSNKSECVYFD